MFIHYHQREKVSTCAVRRFTAKAQSSQRFLFFAVPCPPSRAQARQAGLNGKEKIIYLCVLCVCGEYRLSLIYIS